MTDTGFYRWFREAKALADKSAGGDVAALLDKGTALLEEHGFGPRSHQDAAQRAAHWSSRFGGGEWASVRECAAVFEAADPRHVAAVMQAAAPRSADMNEDLLGWLLGEQSKNLSLPGPGENLRPWAQRVLQFIMNLSEQPAKNYLGMLIAVADPETGHAATQQLELGRLLSRARAKQAAPESVISRLDRVRPLRNSAAHMANLSIVGGRIELQGDNWAPEALIGELENLLQTVGVLSLAVAIGSGRAARAALSDGGDGSAPGTADDSLVPMEDLLGCWMEWSDVKAARSGPQITVTARASGPILFCTLIQAVGFFRGYEGTAEAVFDIDHNMDDIGRVVIGSPILPPDADEQARWDSMPRLTIDGEPIHGAYGGIARLMDDHRFVANFPDTPEGQETEHVGPPGPVIRAWGYSFTPRASGFLAPP